MKKTAISMILIMVISLLSANKVILDESKTTGAKIQSDTGSYLEIEFNVKDVDFSNVSTEKRIFTSLNIGKGYSTKIEGSPALPAFHELIAMPYGAEPTVKILSYDSKTYRLSDLGIEHMIVPAQPSYSKSSKPEDRKFIYNESAYSTSKFIESDIATVSKSGTMRGIGIGVLKVNPIKYNPTEGTIEVLNNLRVRVNYVNADPRAEEIKADLYSPYFESAYNTLINYKPSSAKADLMSYPVSYLIVCSDALTGNEDLQRLIDWKTEKGFNVLVNYVAASSTIFDNDVWVEEQYTHRPTPSFVLLIGDESGTYNVESQDNPPLGSTGSVTRSDLEYGVIGATATDNRIPSIYVGRFSIRSEAELTAQVDKTIWYEKEQFTTSADLSYLTYTLGCAGVDASWAPTHGDPQISYGWTHYFTSANGMANNLYYLSDTSNNSGTASEIISYIDSGSNFYNYTAHGYNGGFGTPSFTITNINNLTNAGKYPLVVGNCCLTGSFGDTECFGEAWLNIADKGAIGYIGASMSTYWDEDLAMGVGTVPVSQVPPAKDVANPGMYDGVMELGYSSQAATKHVGLMAVEILNTSYTDDYWSSYHLFGDPSVMIYFGIPDDNVVTHLPTVAPGVTTYEINALEGSYVAMSDDAGVLHGVGLVSATGSITLNIEPYVSGNAHLVVTSQFKKPYFEDIQIAALTGPYISIKDFTVNGNLYGSTATADIELKNIGVESSPNVNITGTTDNPYITFNDDTENYGELAVDDSLNKSACISFDISHNIPDEEEVNIDITITDDYSKNVYYGSINFVASAPNIIVNKTLPTETINPGDSQEFIFNIENKGSADMSNITAELTETMWLNVAITEPVDFAQLLAGANQDVSFTCDFDASILNTSTAYFNLNVSSANGFSADDTFEIVLGMTDDFESGDFTENPWTQSGNGDWTIDNTTFYDGSYSSKSGNIGDNEYSRMSLNFDFIEDGSVSFYRSVSSESNYDFLRFFIDGNEKNSWSGSLSWEQVSYDVSTGVHDLHWQYDKDVNTSGGSDCGWIDNILVSGLITGIEEFGNLPVDNKLYQNYPNPFNPVTDISFYITQDNEVRLSIFNTSGQLVKELVNGRLNKGMHKAIFNASSLNSGVYFYTLEVDAQKLSSKMLLIK